MQIFTLRKCNIDSFYVPEGMTSEERNQSELVQTLDDGVNDVYMYKKWEILCQPYQNDSGLIWFKMWETAPDIFPSSYGAQ